MLMETTEQWDELGYSGVLSREQFRQLGKIMTSPRCDELSALWGIISQSCIGRQRKKLWTLELVFTMRCFPNWKNMSSFWSLYSWSPQWHGQWIIFFAVKLHAHEATVKQNEPAGSKYVHHLPSVLASKLVLSEWNDEDHEMLEQRSLHGSGLRYHLSCSEGLTQAAIDFEVGTLSYPAGALL